MTGRIDLRGHDDTPVRRAPDAALPRPPASRIAGCGATGWSPPEDDAGTVRVRDRDPVTAATTAARGVPRWLVVLLGLAATVITVTGLRAAAATIAPVVLALVLTAAAHPVLRWCRRHGAPQWLAVVATLLVVYAVVIGLVVALAASVGRLTSVLPQYSEQWADLLDDIRSALQQVGIDSDEARQALDGVQLQSVVGFLGQLFGGLLGVAGVLLFVLFTV